MTNGRGGPAPRPSTNPDHPLPAAKAAARTAAKARRAAAHAAAGSGAPAAVLAHLLAAVPVRPDAVVSGYMPMADELDVLVPLAHFHRRGHPCCLPVVVGRGLPLTFRAWRPGQALAPGPMGVLQPAADAPERVPSLLLVPLLAFDRRGNRIGYGAGFYDRTLARLRDAGPTLAVGVAYAGQEAPEVPAGPADERLDWIVTEREAIFVAGRQP